jgi:proline dehydrogenase
MNEERGLAQQGNYESPVWDTIEETHKCYNKNMEHLITNMTKDDMVFVASHNVETIELAKMLVVQKDLKASNCVRFGQLRGFSDQVTGGLAAEGFRVYKYVPFGPTE